MASLDSNNGVDTTDAKAGIQTEELKEFDDQNENRKEKNKEVELEVLIRKSRPWSPAEDLLLKKAVVKNGPRHWNFIASFVPDRQGKQCRERWASVLDPKIKKTPWTEEEKRIMLQGVEQYGHKFSKISALLPGRSESQVKNIYYSIQRKGNSISPQADAEIMASIVAGNAKMKPTLKRTFVEIARKFEIGDWTPKESTKLIKHVDKMGTGDWGAIAEKFKNRDASACEKHWREVLSPTITKGRGSWTPDEDKELIRLVKLHGPVRWAQQIAKHFPGRIGKQCRERWYNTLDPGLKRGPWTEVEKEKLKKLHELYGNKWSKIAKELPGRSDNDCKNHWNGSNRRTKVIKVSTKEAEKRKAETLIGATAEITDKRQKTIPKL